MGNLRFPPRGPSLQPPPESPFPFRVERLPVRPASSCSNKSFAFGTLGLVATGSHGGATKLNASFSPFPPYRPAGGSGPLRSCSHPGNPSGGGTGYARKGSSLVLTSCRPAYGDGCLRPPVPKAKLWLEQAGSEHRASARGKGGDSGVWKGASKGGNAPITGPFPPPGGHKGNVMERKGENGKCRLIPQRTTSRVSPPPDNFGGGGTGYARRVTPLA